MSTTIERLLRGLRQAALAAALLAGFAACDNRADETSREEMELWWLLLTIPTSDADLLPGCLAKQESVGRCIAAAGKTDPTDNPYNALLLAIGDTPRSSGSEICSALIDSKQLFPDTMSIGAKECFFRCSRRYWDVKLSSCNSGSDLTQMLKDKTTDESYTECNKECYERGTIIPLPPISL